jgi:lysyl-tRNA synthetase class I
MTNVVTFELPDWDDYTIEDEMIGKDHVAIQTYVKNGKKVAEAHIYFRVDPLTDAPVRMPFKFVLKDHTEKMVMTESKE